jgi:ABC-2 type transport system ATP-binding protein
MPEPIIAVHGLGKQYSGRGPKAVDDIDFAVNKGEVFGLLGPNGAGKSTTIGILTTRVRATQGRALVAGVDVKKHPAEVKQRIAVVPQHNNLDRSLTAIENLTFHAAYFGAKRHERLQKALHLLKEFGLSDRADDKVDKFSGGMIRRLLIARALMHAPYILFLDEPSVGLDPQSRLFLWERICALNRAGLTIFLTTHDMEEAESLCGRVAILDHGKILALDDPEGLRALVPAGTRVDLRLKPGACEVPEAIRVATLARISSLKEVISAEWISGSGTSYAKGDSSVAGVRVYAAQGGEVTLSAAHIIIDSGLELADVSVRKPNLEDVFLELTGRGIRD